MRRLRTNQSANPYCGLEASHSRGQWEGDLVGHARDDGDAMDRLPLLDAVIVLGDLSI